MNDAPAFTGVTIDAATFESHVRRLLRPRGGSRPWPKKQLERWILLYCLSRRLHDGESLREREVNERLQDWLIGPGAQLEIDFVTLRRALIDEGFWDRDSGGSSYRPARRHEARVRFAAGLADEMDVLANEDAARPGAGPA